MKRLTIEKPHKLFVEEIDDQKPGENEIKVEISHCGICGSDVHVYEGLHPYVTYPVHSGHELSGKIIELGKITKQTEFKHRIGQKVTIEPNIVCGHCYPCSIGKYNICENLKVMGFQTEGGMAEYIIVPVEKVIPIPQDMPMDEATLIEPLAVAIHAVNKSKVQLGSNVVILGAGTIGLMLLQVAKQAGAKQIVVTDRIPKRLELAKELGATQVIHVDEEDPIQVLKEEEPFEGWEVVFEAVGIEPTMQQALQSVHKGGQIMIVGVFGKRTKLDIGLVQDRELEIEGSLMYTKRDFKEAIHLLNTNQVQVASLITGVYSLLEAELAFKATQDKEEHIKILIEINN